MPAHDRRELDDRSQGPLNRGNPSPHPLFLRSDTKAEFVKNAHLDFGNFNGFQMAFLAIITTSYNHTRTGRD